MVTAFIIIFSATITMADWDPGDGNKMHFPQPPDEAGWDVYTSDMNSIGDDWMCSESGWVKEIHFWGSWYADDVGSIGSFRIGICADIPANPPDNPYSRPGQLLWDKMIPMNMVTVRSLTSPTPQGWYTPSTGDYIPDDHTQYFQYNIFLPDTLWFWQEEGTIYWLVIFANTSMNEFWGWKSSIENWNDNAVYWDPLFMSWYPMSEPPGFTDPLDLAFVINGDTLPPDIACCLPEGDCVETDSLTCIDQLGGTISPYSDYCLGDANVNGIDDACDTDCFADGDINNDGSMNVGDMVALVTFLRFGEPEPFPWSYNADINGDGYVDYGDIDMYMCRFEYGMSCFDTVGGYPVPTTCHPELTTGACCRLGQCDLRAGVNCESIGGEYLGDGTSCWPDNPCGDTCDFQNPGDVDNNGNIDVQDITYFVDWWYNNGPSPPVLANADVDGNCCIDSTDIVFLVDNLYHGGPAPVECTCVEPFICDCIPGDANGDLWFPPYSGGVNVADAVYLINHVFSSGPASAPYETCSGDANCDCTANVGDVVYIISYVFKGGPPPCTCCEWIGSCGEPLH
jgi:hypothetical protein